MFDYNGTCIFVRPLEIVRIIIIIVIRPSSHKKFEVKNLRWEIF